MSGERYVLLGLARARAAWFREVSEWATSASIAAEFIKCVSAEELRARLASGRPVSAVLVDADLPEFDRDLVAAAAETYTPVIAVAEGRVPRWSASDIGVTAVLVAPFGRPDLLDTLERHTRTIGRGDLLPPLLEEGDAPRWWGTLVAVCGSGGTGASTVAIAAAQALAADVRTARRVCLADLALRADQAMIHDTVDLGPGVQELVEAHRLGRPEPDEVRAMTFDIDRRGYRLLVGLRQPERWSALRPRAVEAAVGGLRRAFQAVVADVTGDVEGEAQGGSVEVEERNVLARTALLRADAVLVVGAAGFKGLHSTANLVRSLVAVGVEAERVLVVINRAPRAPHGRAQLARTLQTLLGPDTVAGVAHLPERRLDDALRDGAPLPDQVVRPVGGALAALLERRADLAPPSVGPERIAPGALGTWR